MSGRSSNVEEAKIAIRRLQNELGAELRNARLSRGLRQADVARIAGSSHAHISRLERGALLEVGLADLARHGAVVGLRLRARFYPTGGGLRDEGQLALLRSLRARIGESFSWQLEAPIGLPGDLRAFDAILRNGTVTVAVEAITRLYDIQAQVRAITLKQRDGGVDRVVIAVRASDANRRALLAAREILGTAYPLGTKATLTALTNGRDPGANGIVLL